MSVTTTNGVAYGAGNPYYDTLMTNYFLQLLPDARNNSTVLLGMIQKRPHEAISGRGIVWPTRYGRNTGMNNVGIGALIPDPGYQNATMNSTTSRKGMARIALDGDVIRRGKTNGGAYATALQIEMTGIIDDISVDRGRQVHNDGSGRLAEISSISTTTITLKVNSSLEGAANTRAAGTLEQYFEPGTRIAAMTNAGVLKGAASQKGYYVLNATVSGANVTIQVAATPGGAAVDTTGLASAWAATDWLVRVSVDGAAGTVPTKVDSAFKSEIMGFGGIYSDIGVLDGITASGSQQSFTYDNTSTATTWFQGVVCSTNPWNQGVVLDNSGAGNRPITEALMQGAISDAERINNANVEFLLSHPHTYDSYVALLTPDKRYQNTTDLMGGHKSLSFNGLPWIKDRFAYQNRVYFSALDQIEMLETNPITALTTNDVTVWERLQDYDKYWRGWTWDDQVIVSGVRNRCGAVLTELNA